MKIAFFVHSLISDWNHGNAHFLRGVCTELLSRGHDVVAFEPEDSWSRSNLIEEFGEVAARQFRAAFPRLDVRQYVPGRFDAGQALQDADLVVVHEWNEPALVAHLGAVRSAGAGFRLLFHDTHHRSITEPETMARFDLRGYDGVLAFGVVIREIYLRRGWTHSAWTWHEAADTRIFQSIEVPEKDGDLVWIGNWGDDERTDALREFFLDPVRQMGLRAHVFGVRYPPPALHALHEAGIAYGGWIANYRVPEVFARFKATVHIPRRPYARSLIGIPTIRPFEAMACGIPLVSAPWDDAEGLFEEGQDYLVARHGAEMVEMLRAVLDDPTFAHRLAGHARATIERRHTCAHRVSELLDICEMLGIPSARSEAA